jgi:hypothetical protein
MPTSYLLLVIAATQLSSVDFVNRPACETALRWVIDQKQVQAFCRPRLYQTLHCCSQRGMYDHDC